MTTGATLLRVELREFAARHALSRREHEVVLVLVSGMTTVKGIAEALGLSAHTVQNHFKRIFRKTGTRGRSELLSSFLRHAMRRQAARRPLVRRPRLLIVDDDRELGEALRRTLSRRGVVVRHEPDPRRALGHLEAQRFDVVALDVEMPEISGPALLAQIRARFPDGPALFLMTGDASYGSDRYLALGAQAFFPKPPDTDALTFAVLEHVVDSPYEHSRFLRVDAALPVRVNGALDMEIEDIGFGGAFIGIAPEQLDAVPQLGIGRRVDLEIALGGQAGHVGVTGEVVWQRVAAAPLDRPGVGIKFVRMGAETRARIEAFVRRRKLATLAPWDTAGELLSA